MSQRPLIAPNPYSPLINNASMSSNIIGPATIIQLLPGISYDISWTGSPVGTFSVQVSNTYQEGASGSVLNAGNWTTLPSSAFVGTYPVPSGSAGNGFLDVVGTEAYAIRFVYNYTSGTGNLTVIPCAKVL